MSIPELIPGSTALIVIDLQRGIVARQVAPHPPRDVVERAARIANALRAAGGRVVLVRVAYAADEGDRLRVTVDAPMPPGPMPSDWADLVPEVGPRDGDLVITKHQWGAFYGTELDLQLRRRGIRTLLLCGISTNFGVESTARDGWERGYQLLLVEDAMAGLSAEAHAFAVGTIFPRLGIVRSTAQVLEALEAPAQRRV
jgi:nicotinamidase-related amidase